MRKLDVICYWRIRNDEMFERASEKMQLTVGGLAMVAMIASGEVQRISPPPDHSIGSRIILVAAGLISAAVSAYGATGLAQLSNEYMRTAEQAMQPERGIPEIQANLEATPET